MPRKWTQQFNVQKGDELEVQEEGNRIIVSTEKGFEIETVELDATDLGIMTQRCVHALYKKGADEIRLTFRHPELIESVQNALGKEAVGFEITEQGTSYCIIKHVSGELQEFDSVLRRVFLILISMADGSFEAIKKKDFSALKSIAFLEEANNRFTTSCRRFINKKGYKDPKKSGPVYYIIEEIERIADEYKYLCKYMYNLRGKKITVGRESLQIYKKTNSMLKNFYELFYKFDKGKMVDIAERRKEVVDSAYLLFEKSRNPVDRVIAHHLIVIAQKIFSMLGPYLVITL